MSFCILGLFELYMPLLYGEGGVKAFLRLQLEILSISDDESIFTWGLRDGDETNGLDAYREDEGLLALRPMRLKKSGCVKTYPEPERVIDRLPYTMTNMGLQLNVARESANLIYNPDREYNLELNCYESSISKSGDRVKNRIMIHLIKPTTSSRRWLGQFRGITGLPGPSTTRISPGEGQLTLYVHQPRGGNVSARRFRLPNLL
jgi:hypothetical protein